MKNLIAICLLTGLCFFTTNCDKAPLMDSDLIGNWRLDSLSHITGAGGSSNKTDYDTMSVFDGVSIVFTFQEDFTITSRYGGLDGGGEYSLENISKINIDDFHRRDKINIESEWFSVSISAINEAESYSIVGSKLSVFYNNNSRHMHFTKL
jgi:hypothetical protein